MTQDVAPLILIADDQLPTTLMLERVFETQGYRVKSVHDGAAVIEYVRTEFPSLILLDINMPRMNGFEVLKSLRADPATANIPTILITAMGELSDVVHGLQLGADDYIRKPFHPQELLARAQSKMRARQLEVNLQRRTQELEALLRVSEELSQHLDIQELLDFVLYLVIDLVPCSIAAIYLLDGDEILNSSMRFRDGMPVEGFLGETELIQHVLQEKHPILSNNNDTNDAQILIPIIYAEEVKGVLYVQSSEIEYDHNHAQVLNGIGRQAALALRNAELYQIQANYAQHLEDMVKERTKELESAQQMLVRSEKLASVGRLAASIAHEIKNPLMPIRLNLEGILEDVDKGLSVERQDIERSLESAQRIQMIVDNVLGFTGKGHSKQADFQLVDINDIINDIIDLNKKALEHNNIEIVTELAELLPVMGNKYQLEQVFMNLILNAKDAMGKHGTLTIRTVQNNKEVIASVHDTGIGIPPGQLEQLFEPFITTKEDGNGLGLFISYGIIQNHHGSMKVQSTVGQGTTFYVRLPVHLDMSPYPRARHREI